MILGAEIEMAQMLHDFAYDELMDMCREDVVYLDEVKAKIKEIHELREMYDYLISNEKNNK